MLNFVCILISQIINISDRLPFH